MVIKTLLDTHLETTLLSEINPARVFTALFLWCEKPEMEIRTRKRNRYWEMGRKCSDGKRNKRGWREKGRDKKKMETKLNYLVRLTEKN